ncbi:antibiotic biosynthesis monooxygenase family protein [Thalassomonas sp. M1454]|uniref:antibiotic biosynthesis monooxygenase family protein n=1 Tax=Thalassomonas sp. M1454 TaxID=2594477 RepID=UPI00117E82A7|nr:antibiotic biosynthesis monooxygenase [Thalassomonas sp. M1454]TRX55114.1 antibiotic biosynthesis monooxygenase [Thalassomonas sp. M1454]
MFANTPKPPYYAVIFTSIMNESSPSYASVAERMVNLAKLEPGFLGIESARNEVGITVSYWRDLASIKRWKENAEHKIAQQKGKDNWYKSYKTRICLVERDYQKI